MRIAHLISSGQLGGAEASLLEMIGSVRDAQPSWLFLVVVPERGPLEERLYSLGIPVEVLPFPSGLSRLGEAGQEDGLWGRVRLGLSLARASGDVWTYRRQLRRVLGASGTLAAPDVVHAHGFKMHVLSAWSAAPQSALIWHMHDYITPRPVSGRLLRRLSPRCVALIANSRSVAEDIRRVGARAPIETIYNGVDLSRFSPAGPSLDLDRLGCAAPAPHGTIRVGLLATFGRWKGQRTFLAALAQLPRELPVRGYVIGGPLYQTQGSQLSEAELRQTVADLGIGDRVVFTGPVRDAAGALRALDIVVHASTEPEPFGMVIAEAMACARPIVASVGGGAAELIDDGVDGLGYPPADERRLAALITQLANDPGLRRTLGSAGRRSAERRFDRARVAAELIPIYQRSGAR